MGLVLISRDALPHNPVVFQSSASGATGQHLCCYIVHQHFCPVEILLVV